MYGVKLVVGSVFLPVFFLLLLTGLLLLAFWLVLAGFAGLDSATGTGAAFFAGPALPATGGEGFLVAGLVTADFAGFADTGLAAVTAVVVTVLAFGAFAFGSAALALGAGLATAFALTVATTTLLTLLFGATGLVAAFVFTTVAGCFLAAGLAGAFTAFVEAGFLGASFLGAVFVGADLLFAGMV